MKSQKHQVDTKSTSSRWSSFSPKCSNGRSTVTLYSPLSRESQLGVGGCLKTGVLLHHQCWQRSPDIFLMLTVLVMVHTAGPGAEAGGSSSLRKLQNPPFLQLTKRQLMLLLWHLSEERDETSSPISTHSAKLSDYAEPRKRQLLSLHAQLQVLNSRIIAIAFLNSSQSLSEMILQVDWILPQRKQACFGNGLKCPESYGVFLKKTFYQEG